MQQRGLVLIRGRIKIMEKLWTNCNNCYVIQKQILWPCEFSLFYFNKSNGLEDRKLMNNKSKSIYVGAYDPRTLQCACNSLLLILSLIPKYIVLKRASNF